MTEKVFSEVCSELAEICELLEELASQSEYLSKRLLDSTEHAPAH